MKTLIVEDDFTSWQLLRGLLKPFGDSDVAADGNAAVSAFRTSLEKDAPYDLVCLDIMMPGIDGQQVLKEIRRLEEEHGVLVGRGAKIIMTSALGNKENVLTAFRELCDAYLVKPISKRKLLEHLRTFGLIT